MPKKQKTLSNKSRVPFYVEKINEKTKESFLIDTQNLSHKLEQYEQKHKNLLERSEYLENKVKSAKRNERSAIDFVNKELTAKSAELSKLKDGLKELKESRMLNRQKAEENLKSLKKEIQDMKTKLNNDNKFMASQLKSLEDFKVHQNEVTSKVTKLKKQLKAKKFENAKEIELMMKVSIELASRTKEEAMQMLASAASDLKKETTKTMPKLLMRAIHENVAVEAYCRFMANKSNFFEGENEMMKGRIAENENLRREMERKERELFKELVEKNKLIKLVKEKLSEKTNPASSVECFQQLEDENKSISNEIEMIKREQEDVDRNCHVIESEMDGGLKVRTKDLDKRLDSLRDILYKANVFIKKLYFEGSNEGSIIEHFTYIHRLLTEVDIARNYEY